MVTYSEAWKKQFQEFWIIVGIVYVVEVAAFLFLLILYHLFVFMPKAKVKMKKVLEEEASATKVSKLAGLDKTQREDIPMTQEEEATQMEPDEDEFQYTTTTMKGNPNTLGMPTKQQNLGHLHYGYADDKVASDSSSANFDTASVVPLLSEKTQRTQIHPALKLEPKTFDYEKPPPEDPPPSYILY
ncbi:hypothetical protein Q1695_012250 [Nippostrongylus brasiliensis]|nr:hypothetical protein Q1695_012250 [Nippostrongylus brasiliensis]